MATFESLSHSRWECKYHVVLVPKCRKKALYGKIRNSTLNCKVSHDWEFLNNLLPCEQIC
jgi:REP element-mobilizing transposase RayT